MIKTNRVNRYLRVLLMALVVATVAFAAVPANVHAIADPDTAPSVNAVYVYEDCLETGDTGVLIDYYLDYAVLPTETAYESYMAVFVDTDGVTQLKSVAPYVYTTSGYRRSLMCIYFTAAETTAYSLDAVDVALYRIWLCGNPTVPSGWPGVPPKTVATIDTWQTTGVTSTVLALKVLEYADILELAWALNLISETAIGYRLTTLGEAYFANVIPNLRDIAPSVFAEGSLSPTQVDLDYSTDFEATMTNGTGTVAGSPITLTEGRLYSEGLASVTIADATVQGNGDVAWTASMVGGTFISTNLVRYTILSVTDSDTLELTVPYGGATLASQAYTIATGEQSVNVTALGTTGTFTIELSNGARGIVTSDTGTVTGSPVTLKAGINTITVTVIGLLTIVIYTVDTQAAMDNTILGTGLDLTAIAVIFGMTREVFSGLVWLIITIIICAAVYGKSRESPDYTTTQSGKIVILIFDVCIIGGALLGLLPVVVAALLFIGFMALTGYVVFHRQANY
jgi:hypothetical protein